jgi:hypothetical protein
MRHFANVRRHGGASHEKRRSWLGPLVTLYERTSLTLREIATVAGSTERAMQIRVRALGCPPCSEQHNEPGLTMVLLHFHRQRGQRHIQLIDEAGRLVDKLHVTVQLLAE